ncbi:MAG: LysR family transcriptional regulator [Lachnospiraceae bacterium]|nr:LysR family transcriptional regulator [Lachnospiraceae bacterium]
MKLQNLRYVQEIIRQGSVSAAARKLYISQSYLSKILMEVEKEYQITIFQREKNNLVLTRNGTAFSRTVQEMLETMEHYDRRLHDTEDTRYFSFSSCPSAYTMEAYLEFLRLNPDTSLRVHYQEGDNGSVINDVYARASEFGIIILNNEEIPAANMLLKSMQLHREKLTDLEFRLIARIGHPLSRLMRPAEAEDLYDYDFVLYPQQPLAGGYAVQTAQYEYRFLQLDWNRIRQITYVQGRAQYYDLIQRTDTISFGFTPMKNQEITRNIVSLHLAPSFLDTLKQDTDSTLYCICAEGHVLSKPASEFLECLKEVCS